MVGDLAIQKGTVKDEQHDNRNYPNRRIREV
jgi:hypothetical protein